MEKNKNKYQVVFENAGTNVIIQDGKFREVNPKFEELTGYSREELIGMNSLRIVPGDEREKVRDSAVKMLKGRREEPYEHRIKTKKGEVRWVLEKVSSILYEGEKCILTSFIDITDRKRAEKAEESLKGLVRGRIKDKIKVASKNLRKLSGPKISEEENEYLEKALDSLEKAEGIIEKEFGEARTKEKSDKKGKVLELLHKALGFVYWSDKKLERDIMEVYKMVGKKRDLLMEIGHSASKNTDFVERLSSGLADLDLEEQLNRFEIRGRGFGKSQGKKLFLALLERERRGIKYLNSLRSALGEDLISEIWEGGDPEDFFDLLDRLIQSKKENLEDLNQVGREE